MKGMSRDVVTETYQECAHLLLLLLDDPVAAVQSYFFVNGGDGSKCGYRSLMSPKACKSDQHTVHMFDWGLGFTFS
jgi:hypothetical protein